MKRLLIAISVLTLITVGFLFPNQTQSRLTAVKAQPKPVAAQSKPVRLVTSQEVENKLNQYRTAHGLNSLRDNPVLDRAAQARAVGMCADNNWSHEGDWALLSRYYRYHYAGENLYYSGLRYNQLDDIMGAWIASPEHLSNIVADYSEFGVGVLKCSNFQGASDTVIVTNYFGVPR